MALPARFFSWRIRGNAMTWAFANRAALLAKPWDVIVATSMVDLATLKGLVPELAHVPTLLYFHENQFSYPANTAAGQTVHSIEPQMVTLYGALAANQVVFNSAHNQKSFLLGVSALLKKLPDHVPGDIIEQLEEKSQVIPVPLEPSCFELAKLRAALNKNQSSSAQELTILWNHRWEYDKGPERLLAIVTALAQQTPSMHMRFHIVGQQFRQVPAAFSQLKAVLTEQGWLGEWGFLPLQRYHSVLASSDIVLSTALHDFQGLAVLDAVAAGCTPLLPKRVAYPDFFSAEYLYLSEEGATYSNETSSAVKALVAYGSGVTALNAPDITQYSWRALTQQYQNAIHQLASQ
ncbi:hypothetical protein MARGE09_P3396 [Marinagarivorans cellulosilyticus]|uniref:tRNA-queuosine alpha-mannosyltransferase n=2 Tax=Marinagarivorans cellulosilyticus TaxID=2721545 RepID=A0AAN2BLM4_9GAMM|nr:hypothetical protein MARGE09_P3396 [Marinagarivorans cellulosilyticus]